MYVSDPCVSIVFFTYAPSYNAKKSRIETKWKTIATEKVDPKVNKFGFHKLRPDTLYRLTLKVVAKGRPQAASRRVTVRQMTSF